MASLVSSLQGLDFRSALTLAVGVPLLTIVLWGTISYLTSPLRRYPGPFLAGKLIPSVKSHSVYRREGSPQTTGWTNIWRLLLVRTGNYHVYVKKLHEKYGPVVRIGPNLLDLDTPDLIKTIYGTDGKWRKVCLSLPQLFYELGLINHLQQTEFYENNSTIIDGKITYHLFSTTSQADHARMKRPIVKYYSMSSVLNLEPLMDTVSKDFLKQLDNRFATKGTKQRCDLGEWIGFCKILPSCRACKSDQH